MRSVYKYIFILPLIMMVGFLGVRVFAGANEKKQVVPVVRYKFEEKHNYEFSDGKASGTDDVSLGTLSLSGQISDVSTYGDNRIKLGPFPAALRRSHAFQR